MSRIYHLFELITSLTPTEKGYFKRYSKLHTRQKDLKYMRLFDEVERSKNYNDKEMQRLVSDEITPKLFPVVKNYLYNLILKSLESYYSGKNPEIEVRNIMNQVTILYNKGLINHAQKGLRKAKSLTDKHELWSLKADLLELQRELLILDISKDLNYQKDVDIIEEEADNLRKMDKLFRCKKFERLLVNQHWIKGIADKEIPLSIEHLYKEIGIFKEEEAETTHAKLHFNQGSLLFYYVKEQNPEKAFYYAAKNYALVRQHPEILDRDEKKYIRVLYIYMGLCTLLKKQNEFWLAFELLDSIKSSNKRIATEIFDQKYNLVFNSSLSFRELDKGLRYLKEFEKQLPKYMDNLSSRSLIVFYHLIAYLLHLVGDYDWALAYTNKIDGIIDKNTRQDIKCVAKIQDIAIHFDLKNWMLLKSKIRNAIRFFKQRNLLQKGELLLLNGLEKIRKRAEANKIVDYSHLLLELQTAREKEENYLWIQRNFDVLEWLARKSA